MFTLQNERKKRLLPRSCSKYWPFLGLAMTIPVRPGALGARGVSVAHLAVGDKEAGTGGADFRMVKKSSLVKNWFVPEVTKRRKLATPTNVQVWWVCYYWTEVTNNCHLLNAFGRKICYLPVSVYHLPLLLQQEVVISHWQFPPIGDIASNMTIAIFCL